LAQRPFVGQPPQQGDRFFHSTLSPVFGAYSAQAIPIHAKRLSYMKYMITLILAAVLMGCGECDNSNYYQIKSITPKGDNTQISIYEANGLGPCTSWQKTEVVNFTDSSSRFKLSQIIDRATILKYESKGSGK
jgi:hypothetical protein